MALGGDTSWGPNIAPGGLQIQPLGDFDLIAGEVRNRDTVFASLRGEIGVMRSVFIDNSRGRGFVILTVQRTGQQAICPPLTQDWFPLYLDANGQVEFYSTVSATVGLTMASVLFQRTGASIIGPPSLSVGAQIAASGTLIAAVPKRRLFVQRLKVSCMISAANPALIPYSIQDSAGLILDVGYISEAVAFGGAVTLCDVANLNWIASAPNLALTATLGSPFAAGNVLTTTIHYGLLPN